MFRPLGLTEIYLPCETREGTVNVLFRCYMFKTLCLTAVCLLC